MPWHVEGSNAACGAESPWAVILDADSSVVACYADEDSANAAVAELQTADAGGAGNDVGADVNVGPEAGGYATAPVLPGPPVTGAPMQPEDAMPGMGAATVAWDGVLAVEGTPTGDGRQFTPGALSWAELPVPLRWQCEDTHGGVLVNGVVTIGRIDGITRAGSEIRGHGVIDLGSPEGVEAARRMGTQAAPGFLSGISIDADDPSNGLVDYVMAPGCEGLDPAAATEADFERCASPELTVYHAGRIRAATLCDIPAFVQARVYLTDAGAATLAAAAAEDCGCEESGLSGLIAAAHAITLSVPDAAAFTEPTGPAEIGAITVTDDGRIFGYLAPAKVAHRGYPDRAVYAPTGTDYTRWMNRPTITAGGARIATGAITMGCGHAPTHRGVTAAAALEHYDNTCSVIATARVGENRHGVWIAGALLPDVTPAQVARLLACQLSGDWRPNRDRPGTRELVGVLAVPVPGFPVAHGMRVSTEGGQLVASAVPIRTGPAPDTDALAASAGPNPGLVTAARILAAATGRDRASRLAALATRVRGGP